MQPETAKLVAQMLGVNTALTSLCVGDRNFGDLALRELAAGLKNNTSLQKLDLEQRSVTVEGVQALSQSLNHDSGIRQLNLSRNHLGDQGRCTSLVQACCVTSETTICCSIAHGGCRRTL